MTPGQRVTWQQVSLVVGSCALLVGMMTWVDARIEKEAHAREAADSSALGLIGALRTDMTEARTDLAVVLTDVRWMRQRMEGPNFREPPDDVQVPRRERTIRPGQRWKGDGGLAHAPDGGDDE